MKDWPYECFGVPCVLRTNRWVRDDFCGCVHCEGHPVFEDLAESEWWWEPLHQRVDMSDVCRLEESPSLLVQTMGELGKEQPAVRWFEGSDECGGAG